MELALKYVYKVYEVKSFSGAAKELFVSQPALSATVARLEKELGFRIFDRSSAPLSLTSEGRIYIDLIEEMMESELNMKRRLHQLSDLTYGSLSIGASSYTSYYFLPTVCGVFSQRYPQIEIRMDMGNIGSETNLTEKLKRRSLDLLFAYDFDPTEHDAIPLLEEHLVIAMHRRIAEEHGLLSYAVTRGALLTKSYDPACELEDLSVFKEIPFLRFPKGNTDRHMKELFGEYKASHFRIDNARHSGVHFNMMCAGLGALLTTDSMAFTSIVGENDVLYFLPKGAVARRTLFGISKAGYTLTPIAKQFLTVAADVGKTGKALHLNF